MIWPAKPQHDPQLSRILKSISDHNPKKTGFQSPRISEIHWGISFCSAEQDNRTILGALNLSNCPTGPALEHWLWWADNRARNNGQGFAKTLKSSIFCKQISGNYRMYIYVYTDMHITIHKESVSLMCIYLYTYTYHTCNIN